MRFKGPFEKFLSLFNASLRDPYPFCKAFKILSYGFPKAVLSLLRLLLRDSYPFCRLFQGNPILF